MAGLKPPPSGPEPTTGESQDSPVEAQLTREEYLERHVWTLEYYFDDLVKEDLPLALEFLRYAAKTVKVAIKKEKAQ